MRTSHQKSLGLRSVAFALMITGILAACSTPAQTPSANPSPSATDNPLPSPTPSIEPSAPAEVELWPLTGLPSEQPQNRPAVAVKIENATDARPQYGLEEADVVWETVVEAGISRFIAVFHSHYPKEIGPVRSVRPVDVPISAPLNGLLVYSGGQQGVLRVVHASPTIQSLTEDSGNAAMWRNQFRRAPHNLNADVAQLAALAGSTHSNSPSTQFTFAASPQSATAVTHGVSAKALSVTLSMIARPHWKWTRSDGWLRYEGQTPAVSASGEHLSATNVVLLFANKLDSGFQDVNGVAVPNYTVLGSGKAVVATEGMVIEGEWSKESNTEPFVLRTDDGTEITLAPGNTWVELVPAQTGTYAVGSAAE